MAPRHPARRQALRQIAERQTGTARSLCPGQALGFGLQQDGEESPVEPAVTRLADPDRTILESSQASSMPSKKLVPSYDLMVRVRQAFHSYGYDRLTMIDLASHCEFTRRALYFYFSSKEEAFRAVVAYFNTIAIRLGLEAGDHVRTAGGSAVDIVAEILNIRYGETRRNVSRSPHLIELNGEAFRRCHDLMVESALVFHKDLEVVIRSLAEGGLLVLKPDVSSSDLTQLLTDGARGVNQTLPPLAAEAFAPRYRAITQAILFGCAAAPTASGASTADSAGRPRKGVALT